MCGRLCLSVNIHLGLLPWFEAAPRTTETRASIYSPVRHSLTARQVAKPLTLTNELITGAVNGKNETRLLWIRFQLLPKMHDVRVNRARVRIILVTPHRIQQATPRERFRRMRDKVSQQSKFFRGKIDE